MTGRTVLLCLILACLSSHLIQCKRWGGGGSRGGGSRGTSSWGGSSRPSSSWSSGSSYKPSSSWSTGSKPSSSWGSWGSSSSSHNYPSSSSGLSGSSSSNSKPSGSIWGSSSSNHGYPSSSGLSGSSNSKPTYPSSSSGLSGTGSSNSRPSYPSSPSGLSGTGSSNSRTSYPSSSSGLSGTGSSNSRPSYPSSSSGLSGSSNSKPKWETNWSNSGSGSSHNYPSSSTGLSGSGSASRRPTYPSSSTGLSGSSYPKQEYYHPTHTYNPQVGHTFGTYGPGYSGSYYTSPQYVYIHDYRNSGSRYGDLLTGLALYDLGRSHSHYHHYYHDDYYGRRYDRSNSYPSGSYSSDAKQPETALCTLKIKDNGREDTLKIPCEIVSTFTEGSRKVTPDKIVNTTVCVTNSTTVNNTEPVAKSSSNISETAMPNLESKTSVFSPNSTIAASNATNTTPNVTASASNASGTSNGNAGASNTTAGASNTTTVASNTTAAAVNTTRVAPNATTVATNVTVMNSSTCTTTVVATDPLKDKGPPVNPSQMECTVEIRTKEAVFQNNVDCKVLMQYSKMPEPKRDDTILPQRSIISACWVAGAGVGLLPLFGWHAAVPAESGCYFVEVMDYNYLLFLYLATIVTPSVLLAAFYAHIYRVVVKQMSEVMTVGGSQGRVTGGGGGTMLRVLGAAQKREVKATQNLAIIVFFFMLCWIPLYTINAIKAFMPHLDIPNPLTYFAIVFSHLNSAINPLLYAYHLKDFRAALKGLICTILGRGVPIPAAYRPPLPVRRLNLERCNALRERPKVYVHSPVWLRQKEAERMAREERDRARAVAVTTPVAADVEPFLLKAGADGPCGRLTPESRECDHTPYLINSAPDRCQSPYRRVEELIRRVRSVSDEHS